MTQTKELFDTQPFTTTRRGAGTLVIEGRRTTSMKPTTWLALVHLKETLEETSRRGKNREKHTSRN